jgi:hypothetical protein
MERTGDICIEYPSRQFRETGHLGKSCGGRDIPRIRAAAVRCDWEKVSHLESVRTARADFDSKAPRHPVRGNKEIW